jgi:diacylglycerol kinase family enzyme
VTQHHHAVASFDRIVVIFNPHSTGDGPRLAEELYTDLTTRLPEVPVGLCPTERTGHARDIARETAQTGHPLIVSVSGDGGYNGVVDGVMQAGNDNGSVR